jgi:hypothetical protein
VTRSNLECFYQRKKKVNIKIPICLGCGVPGADCGGGAGTLKLFKGCPCNRLLKEVASVDEPAAGELPRPRPLLQISQKI